MNSWTIEKDTKHSDNFLNISETEKRLIRVGVRTYKPTGTYLTVKLFKKNDSDEFVQNQRVTLSLNEFQKLAESYQQIQDLRKISELDLFKNPVPDADCFQNSKKPKLDNSQKCSTQ